MQSITLKVEGMSCSHCVNSVEGAVNKLGAAGKVDLNAGAVTVEYDEAIVTLNAIKEAIEEQGYDVVKS
ncbi:copper ion binding protein [Paenibacillus sp. TAB 01]|uniref:copper ion binding protein n=1 Tax=Paenibacillus sp. TAB 01 TaxID=3368988 RepID=UPI003751993F